VRFVVEQAKAYVLKPGFGRLALPEKVSDRSGVVPERRDLYDLVEDGWRLYDRETGNRSRHYRMIAGIGEGLTTRERTCRIRSLAEAVEVAAKLNAKESAVA